MKDKDLRKILDDLALEYNRSIHETDKLAMGTIRDILTDIRHICKDRGIDFEDALEGSEEVFNEEVALQRKGKQWNRMHYRF